MRSLEAKSNSMPANQSLLNLLESVVELEATKQRDVPRCPRTGEREQLAVGRPLEVLDAAIVFREVSQLIGPATVERLHPDVG